jgi:hypothetical protein
MYEVMNGMNWESQVGMADPKLILILYPIIMMNKRENNIKTTKLKQEFRTVEAGVNYHCMSERLLTVIERKCLVIRTEGEREFSSYGVLSTEGNSQSGLGYANGKNINNQKVQYEGVCWSNLFASSVRNEGLEAGAETDCKFRVTRRMRLVMISSVIDPVLDGVLVERFYCEKFYPKVSNIQDNRRKFVQEEVVKYLWLLTVYSILLILFLSEAFKKLRRLGARTIGYEFIDLKEDYQFGCSGEEFLFGYSKGNWKKELHYRMSRLINDEFCLEFSLNEEQPKEVSSWFSIFLFPCRSQSKSNNYLKKHQPVIVGQWSPSSSEDG